MTGLNELRINCTARPQAARPMRHAMAAFLAASGKVGEERSSDILTAVGEVLANAVEHAYAGEENTNDVELFARIDRDDTLAVDVFDRGRFVERPSDANRGFGLRIARAIAHELSVSTANGTHVRMRFTGLA